MRYYRFALLALAVLVLAVFAASGCSSQDRSASTHPATAKTAPVTFVFDLLTAKGEVPTGVAKYVFFGYDDEGCQNQIYTESADRDESLEGKQQEVTLDVPVEVVKSKSATTMRAARLFWRALPISWISPPVRLRSWS